MRKLITLLLFLFAITTFLVDTAEAARFGGGRSFGVQRSFNRFSHQKPFNKMHSHTPRRSSWAAPLAGLAIGSLLGYLLMGHGIGSGLLSWLLIFGIGMLIWSFLRNKLRLSAQTNQFGKGRVFEAPYFRSANDHTSSAALSSYPAGFNQEHFLRDAKVQFIRLQAAYDAKDMNDLREFTAPEVFAEIQMQLQERGQELNHTEVVSLNADLLEVSTENQATLASVKFSGMLREDKNAPAAFFEEAWHFRKDENHKWIVAGLQQNLH